MTLGLTTPTGAAMMHSVSQDDRFELRCETLEKAQGDIIYGIGMISMKKGERFVDLQKDHIPVVEMQKAATNFMVKSRALKAMHAGGVVGEVVHSMPISDELCKAFQKKGVDLRCDHELWLVGVRVTDPNVMAKHERGELPSFSIGGKGRRTLTKVGA